MYVTNIVSTVDSDVSNNCSSRCFYGYAAVNNKQHRGSGWLLLTVASALDRYDLVSKLFFVLQCIGSILLPSNALF